MDIDYVKKNIYIYFPIIYTFLNLLITFVRFMSRNFGANETLLGYTVKTDGKVW